MSEENQEFHIDPDVVIENYNKKNPELREMTRGILAEKLGTTTQNLSDWSRGRSVKLLTTLKTMAEIGGCSIEDFIKPVKTKK